MKSERRTTVLVSDRVPSLGLFNCDTTATSPKKKWSFVVGPTQ